MTKYANYGIKKPLERVFSQIAYRRNAGIFHRVLFFPLYLLSLLYGTVVKIRLSLYSSGLLKAGRLGCKVVSVGNVTVGGTGKTPTVEFVARNLLEKGLKVAVLSRGYKRKGKGIGIVSDGKEILLGPAEAGDEPYMLARRLKGMPVLVGSDRYEAGIFALQRFPLDVIILDDGFQHIKLERDLDIVLVDGEKGFGNGYLLPRGPLREPMSGIKRAGIALVSKAADDSSWITEQVGKMLLDQPVFKSIYRAEGLVPMWSGGQAELGKLSGAKVAAVCAIANPVSFYSLVSSLGGVIVSEIAFSDHYAYSEDDLNDIVEEARAKSADFVITTEKDAVKLGQLEGGMDIPFFYLKIGLDMKGEEKRFIDSVLARIQG